MLTLLCTYRLVLSHLILHPNLWLGNITIHEFTISQWHVYQPAELYPLFYQDPGMALSQNLDFSCLGNVSLLGIDLKINIDYLLHVVRFFKFHMSDPEGILNFRSRTMQINHEHYPRIGWDASLSSTGCRSQSLARNWLGSWGKIFPSITHILS